MPNEDKPVTITLNIPQLNTIFMGLQMVVENTEIALAHPLFNGEARVVALDLQRVAQSTVLMLEKATGYKFTPMPDYEEGDEEPFIGEKN